MQAAFILRMTNLWDTLWFADTQKLEILKVKLTLSKMFHAQSLVGGPIMLLVVSLINLPREIYDFDF